MVTVQVEQDHLKMLQDGFEAFATGDMATLTKHWHRDATTHGVALGKFAATYRGRDAIFSFWGQLKKESGGTFHVTPSAMAASGDKVFVQAEVTVRRNGKALKSDDVLVYTIKDGQIVDQEYYIGDYPTAAAFWA